MAQVRLHIFDITGSNETKEPASGVKKNNLFNQFDSNVYFIGVVITSYEWFYLKLMEIDCKDVLTILTFNSTNSENMGRVSRRHHELTECKRF